MNAWQYFTTSHRPAITPGVGLEIGRHRDSPQECQILGRDGTWVDSPLLELIERGELRNIIIHHHSLDFVADLAQGWDEQYYLNLPHEFPLWQGPMPAEPRWQYIALGWWPVPGSPVNGHDFARWMQTDLPKVPTGESVLRHDDITIGRTNKNSMDPFNFQRLTRDGTWVSGHWQDPSLPDTPDHLANEITDQLALAIIREGYDVGYYRHVPEDLPNPATQTGWAAHTSASHVGHARIHESLRKQPGPG